MSGIIILILTTLFSLINLRRRFCIIPKYAEKKYLKVKNEYESTSTQQAHLARETNEIGKNTEEMALIYTITKEICKSLEEEKILAAFTEAIKNHLHGASCTFLSGQGIEPPGTAADIVLHLTFDKETIGYLMVNGIQDADKEKFQIFAQQLILGFKRAALYKKIQELAITDTLTQTFNRRYLLERLQEELLRCAKFNHVTSLLMVDIDHFKQCNDHYGHLVGDAVLIAISRTIKENVRQIDLVGRYGGEEFAIILTETDLQGAHFAAERIRAAVEQQIIHVYDENIKTTISIGIAIFPIDADTQDALIEKTDEALLPGKKTRP